MTLRLFHPDDTPELAALFLETVRRINIRDYTPEEVAAWAPDNIDVAALGKRLGDAFSLVAEEDGTVVGFGNVEASGHIDCLYVHADFQGEGIGSAILGELEREAKETGTQRLFTEASITAREFFQQQGYALVEQQTVAVRGVELTNYRMEKFL